MLFCVVAAQSLFYDTSNVPGASVNQHLGEDWIFTDPKGNNVTVGAPARATQGGKVIDVGEKKGIGKFVRIQRIEDGVKVRDDYFHLDSINVQEEDVVKEGDLIGRAGGTGTAVPHLHVATSFNRGEVPEKYKDEVIYYRSRAYVNPEDLQ